MAVKSVWSRENRFKSFAPIRTNSAVSWFVDGRDYFWDVSVAIENAKDCIYIHDWWLVSLYSMFESVYTIVLIRMIPFFFLYSHLNW